MEAEICTPSSAAQFTVTKLEYPTNVPVATSLI